MKRATYHAGELAVQARAGVSESASRIGRGIHDFLPPLAQGFLEDQRLAVGASVGAEGSVWASLLTGPPGFLQAIDDRTVRVTPLPVPGDALRERIRVNPSFGMVAIDFAKRRRIRVNGDAELVPGDGFLLHVHQAYANCPKHIQERTLVARTAESAGDVVAEPQPIHTSRELTRAQRVRIARADTFFIASYHPEAGADASHRGGNPGFVRVVDPRTLVFPDYAGNTMFQTLGNFAVTPAVGLLFIDFANGDLLQLGGTARVLWDDQRIARTGEAERLVEITLARVVDIARGSPLVSTSA